GKRPLAPRRDRVLRPRVARARARAAPETARGPRPRRGRGMRYLRSFGRFWWNFIVGDDWRVAAGVAAALALTWCLTHAGVNAWWLLPAAVALVLAESLRRAARGAG